MHFSLLYRTGLPFLALFLPGCHGRGSPPPRPTADSGVAKRAPLVVDASVSATGATAELAPPADLRSYAVALRDGRAAESKGDFAPAMRSFQRALQERPQDQVALSELGWAALQAGDLKVAEEATMQAVEKGGDRRVLAASLYNLGYLRELQQRPDEAVRAYLDSYKWRPAQVVRAAIEKLAPAEAAALDEFSATPLEGPFKSLQEYCKDHQEGRSDTGLEPCATSPIELTNKSASPYLEVVILEPTADPYLRECNLAIRTARGWFVMRSALGTCYIAGTAGSTSVVPQQLSLRELVPGSPDEMTLLFAQEGFNRGDRNSDGTRSFSTTTALKLLLCGLGPSGNPSCIGPLGVSNLDYLGEPTGGDRPASSGKGWQRKVDLPGNGKARLSPILPKGGSQQERNEVRQLSAGPHATEPGAGTYRLVFP